MSILYVVYPGQRMIPYIWVDNRSTKIVDNKRISVNYLRGGFGEQIFVDGNRYRHDRYCNTNLLSELRDLNKTIKGYVEEIPNYNYPDDAAKTVMSAVRQLKESSENTFQASMYIAKARSSDNLLAMVMLGSIIKIAKKNGASKEKIAELEEKYRVKMSKGLQGEKHLRSGITDEK